MDHTFGDIKNMTDEEVAELSRTLAVKVMKRFALFMGIKWALIFTITHFAKKYTESLSKEIETNK